MTQTITPQIHVIPDPDSVSAVFFFGFPASQFTRELIEIHGCSPAPGGTHYRHSGRVLGGDSNSPFVLIVRAGPGSMIELSTCEKTLNFAFPLRLQVGQDLTIEPAMTRSRISVHRSVAMTLLSTRDHNPTQMTLADDDLLAIFADMTLPTWLREVLDSQLVYWDKHHTETYYQFTPWPVRGQEFERCVKAAPYWALARWKTELYPHQRNYCMRRSPAAAVAFCLEHIPPGQRPQLLASNP